MINITLKIKKKISKNNKKDGFTLIEMIAVIAIIGILSTVLIPKVSGYINEAKKTKVVDQCRKVIMAAESYGLRYTPLLDSITVFEIKTKAGVGKYLDGVTLSNLPDATTLNQCKSIVEGAEFAIVGNNDILDTSTITSVIATPSTDNPQN